MYTERSARRPSLENEPLRVGAMRTRVGVASASAPAEWMRGPRFPTSGDDERERVDEEWTSAREERMRRRRSAEGVFERPVWVDEESTSAGSMRMRFREGWTRAGEKWMRV